MFDPKKPVQTRDGRAARIIATDLIGPRPLAAAIKATGEEEIVWGFHSDGRWLNTGQVAHVDLLNVPEETVDFQNIYLTGFSGRSTTPVVMEAGPINYGLDLGSSNALTLKLTRRDRKLVSAEVINFNG